MISSIYVILGAIVGCIILVFYFLNTRINTIFVKLDEMTNGSPKKIKKASTKPPKLDSPVYSITYFSDAVGTDENKYEDLTQTEIQKIKEIQIEDDEEIDEEVNEIIENISE